VDDEQLWALYFGGIAHMQQHPGFTKPGTPHKSITECGMAADQMLKEHRRRWQCQSDTQSEQ